MKRHSFRLLMLLAVLGLLLIILLAVVVSADHQLTREEFFLTNPSANDGTRGFSDTPLAATETARYYEKQTMTFEAMCGTDCPMLTAVSGSATAGDILTTRTP